MATTTHTRHRARTRTRPAFMMPSSRVSRFRLDPSQSVFHRIQGDDPDLPEMVRVSPPRSAAIHAQLVMVSSGGRMITKLLPVSPGVFRGDILRHDGSRCLVLVQRWQNIDSETFIEVRNFFNTSSDLPNWTVFGMVKKLW